MSAENNRLYARVWSGTWLHEWGGISIEDGHLVATHSVNCEPMIDYSQLNIGSLNIRLHAGPSSSNGARRWRLSVRYNPHCGYIPQKAMEKMCEDYTLSTRHWPWPTDRDCPPVRWRWTVRALVLRIGGRGRWVVELSTNRIRVHPYRYGWTQRIVHLLL